MSLFPRPARSGDRVPAPDVRVRQQGSPRQYRSRPGAPPAPVSPPPAPAASARTGRGNRNRARSRIPWGWRHRPRPRPARWSAAAANRTMRRRGHGRAAQSHRRLQCRAVAVRQAAACRRRCTAALPQAAGPWASRARRRPTGRPAPHRAASANSAGAGSGSWPGYALNRAGNKQNPIPPAVPPLPSARLTPAQFSCK